MHPMFIVAIPSYRSAWMAWEIRKAVELKKKLVAAKTDSTNNSPTAMQGVGGVVELDVQLRLRQEGDGLTGVRRDDQRY